MIFRVGMLHIKYFHPSNTDFEASLKRCKVLTQMLDWAAESECWAAMSELCLSYTKNCIEACNIHLSMRVTHEQAIHIIISDRQLPLRRSFGALFIGTIDKAIVSLWHNIWDRRSFVVLS